MTVDRIIFLCNALRMGGSQSVFLRLTRAARDAGFEVILASRGGELAPRFRQEGARIVRIIAREGAADTGDRSLAAMTKAAASLVGVAQVASLVRRPGVLLHASQPWPVAVAAAAAVGSSAPVIWHAHGTTAVEMPPAWMSIVRRKSQAWVRITPEVERALHSVGPGPRTSVITLPNPIDTDVPSDEYARPQRGVIGVLSTLTASKIGYVQACLLAAAGIAEDGTSVHVRVIGDGPERTRIERECRDLEMATRSLTITLHGQSVRPWPVLADCEVVVGMGLVAVEGAIRQHNVVCASSFGLGGRLTTESYETLFDTNFTGRGYLPVTAPGLKQVLLDAMESTPDAGLPALVEAKHGAAAAGAWVRTWKRYLS